jgi:hypothetical protein
MSEGELPCHKTHQEDWDDYLTQRSWDKGTAEHKKVTAIEKATATEKEEEIEQTPTPEKAGDIFSAKLS